MFRAATVLLLTLLVIVGGCSRKGRVEVQVGAAASLLFALSECERRFEAENEVDLVITYAASGSIAHQIRNGAPIDIFFSADRSWLTALEKEGYIAPDGIVGYASGRLVLASPRGAGVEVASLCRLSKAPFERLGIANPELSPYGAAARRALEKCGILEAVRTRLVFGENVAQVMAYLGGGDVDFALVPQALAGEEELPFLEVDGDLHPPIEQCFAIVENGLHRDHAKTFAEFVLSPEGRAVFEGRGFGAPPGSDHGNR